MKKTYPHFWITRLPRQLLMALSLSVIAWGNSAVTIRADAGGNARVARETSSPDFLTAPGNFRLSERFGSKVSMASDLLVTQTASPNPVIVGNNLTYTITVTNQGPDAVGGVVLTSAPTGNFTLISITTSAPQGQCAPAADQVNCSLGILTGGASASAVIVVTATTVGTISNRATVTGNDVDSDATNNSSSISVNVIKADAEASVVSSSINPSVSGQNITLTTTVRADSPTGFTPTGRVTFRTCPEGDCSRFFPSSVPSLGTATLNAVGQAVLTLSLLTGNSFFGNGRYGIFATYEGDVNFNASGPLPGFRVPANRLLSQQVNKASTATTISASLNPATIGQPVTFTAAVAAVAPGAGTATGTVTFRDGTTVLGTGTLTARQATLTTSALTAGLRSITAEYAGDSNFNGSTVSLNLEVLSPAKADLSASSLTFAIIAADRAPLANPATNTFTISNSGGAPLILTPASVQRTGAEISGGKIAVSDDPYFSLRQINANGTETSLSISRSVTIPGGQGQSFRVAFAPVFPPLAGRINNLEARHVLGETISSQLTLTQNAGNPLVISLSASISSRLRLIHPTDSTLGPLVTLRRINDEFEVECFVHDPNLNLNLSRYEFLDSAGRLVAAASDVAITADDLNKVGLVRGQSLNLVQRFLDASRFPQIAQVRISLFDPEGNDTATSGQIITGTGGTLASVSAASYSTAGIAPGAIATAFGENLAMNTDAVRTLPLPEAINGTQIRIRDNMGVERVAPLLFVSPHQVNYLIPTETAAGRATATLYSGDGKISTGIMQIENIGPGLFSANGDGCGVAAAQILRIRNDGSQHYESVSQFDSVQNQFTFRAIDFGPESDQLYLILFGTGLRHLSATESVRVRIGGVTGFDVPVLYAGAQGGFAGLDQVNAALPRQLANRGIADIDLTVAGRVANTLQIRFSTSTSATESLTTIASEEFSEINPDRHKATGAPLVRPLPVRLKAAVQQKAVP